MINARLKGHTKGYFFFDGTGNNAANSLNDPKKYGNITNICRLHRALFGETIDSPTTVSSTREDESYAEAKMYIEGIGTLNGKENSNYAMATGDNPIGYSGYSYADKLAKGLEGLDFLVEHNRHNEIELFVYGFSRGATLARDFAKRALANNKVKIKFLGIFDTVVSLPLHRPNIHFSDQELNRIDNILHLVAINETRKYFPLTSIFSDHGKDSLVEIKNSNDHKVKEIFVPGAHADVGGGYIKDAENIYLNGIRNTQNALQKKLDKIKSTVTDHFSGNTRFPIWKFLLGSNVSFPHAPLVDYNMASNRSDIPIDMANVYFEVMASHTNSRLNEIIFDFNPNVVNASLLELRNNLTKYIKSNSGDGGPNYDYNSLANFTHISANYGTVGRSGINQTLNTFDPKILSIEIQSIVEKHPNEKLEWLNEKAIYSNLGIDVIYVNAPNNDEWHRKVIKG